MFKLLRRVANPIVAITKSDAAIVREIHDDFETASQKALNEAKKILESLNNADAKAQVDALKSAGFNNVPIVKQWHAEDLKRAEAEKRIAAVEKYAIKYPGQKFIFIDQVKAICQKYGLLCVPAYKYKGDVPQKNILEISKFKALPEDTYLEQTNRFSDRVEFDFTKRHNFVDSKQAQKMRDDVNRRNSYLLNDQSLWPTGTALPSYPSYTSMPTFTSVPLFICAPKGDLIVDDNDKVHNGVFMSREIKDPIVLHYVGDGFLIVSKWGPEAEDKDLVNENMN